MASATGPSPIASGGWSLTCRSMGSTNPSVLPAAPRITQITANVLSRHCMRWQVYVNKHNASSPLQIAMTGGPPLPSASNAEGHCTTLDTACPARIPSRKSSPSPSTVQYTACYGVLQPAKGVLGPPAWHRPDGALTGAGLGDADAVPARHDHRQRLRLDGQRPLKAALAQHLQDAPAQPALHAGGASRAGAC